LLRYNIKILKYSGTMTNPTLHCAQCTKPLDAADSICTFCEAAALAQTEHGTAGKYHCPKCPLKFDRPDVKPTPEIVPWHRMHPEKPCCPHCGTFVRSKYTKLNLAIGWLIVPLIIAREWFGFSNPVIYTASMVIVAFCFAWWGVAAWRLHGDVHAYIED
jgi:hypothetical protein